LIYPGDVDRIIEAAALVSRKKKLVARNQALVAVLFRSGLKPGEALAVKWDQLEWVEASERRPWSALIHGLPRKGHDVCIPVHVSAEPWLRAWFGMATTRRRPPQGFIFGSHGRAERPLDWSNLDRVLRITFREAGVPPCDATARSRSYAAFLKQSGLSDYVIRDALGLTSTSSLRTLMRPYRWAAAQRAVAEHVVIRPPWQMPTPGQDIQLGLNLGAGGEE
jgi:integrase